MMQEAERQENAPITRRLQTAQGWLWLLFLDRFSIRFTDSPQSHGGSEKCLEISVALCLCGNPRTPK